MIALLYPRFEKVGGILVYICPSVRPSLPSVLFLVKIFRQRFLNNHEARMLIFGMQVDNDMLYRGIKIQSSPAYSSLYLSNFLSFHTLMKCFVKDFSSTMQGRMLIFGMQLDYDLLYRGIENQSSPAYSSLYLSNFLSFHTLKSDIFVKDFSRTMQPRMLIFGMHVDDDLLYWD